MKSLTGRTALVTGASRGIGKGIALQLARAGADVAVNFNTQKAAAEEVALEIRSLGRKSVPIQANIADPLQAKQLIKKTYDEFGKLDILINNAATVWSMGVFVADSDPTKVKELMETNFLGAYYCSMEAIPYLRREARGDIVFISSTATKHANAGAAPYVASKMAIEGLARCLSKEEQRNNVMDAHISNHSERSATSGQIRVNVLAPTMVATEMGLEVASRKGADIKTLYGGLPFGKLLTTEDMGEACVFLVSDKNQYISGQLIYMDGSRF